MTHVYLTRGQVALVDDADQVAVTAHNWQAVWRTNKWYARARLPSPKAKSVYVYLHRFLAGAPGLDVDHKNGDGLDNRRENLRVATHQQNMMNMRRAFGSKGVCPTRGGKYRAYIVKNAKQKSLGVFSTKAEAQTAYNAAAETLFGEFACAGGTNADCDKVHPERFH